MTSAISPRQDLLCALCERAAITDHHIVHKSMGGDDHDHNLVLLCTEHHAAAHSEKFGGVTWEISKDSDGLRVLEVATGVMIFEHCYLDGFDQGQHIHDLQLLPGLLAELVNDVKYLDNDGLKSAGEIAWSLFGKAAWMYVGEVLRVAKLRMLPGTQSEKLRTIAADLGIGLRHAQQLIQIRETFDTKSISQSPVQESTFFLIAAQQENPQEALRNAEEIKAENPRATVKEYQAVLKTGDTLHRDFCQGDVISGTCVKCGARPQHLRHTKWRTT
mgnify:CR=1 FL=1